MVIRSVSETGWLPCNAERMRATSSLCLPLRTPSSSGRRSKKCCEACSCGRFPTFSTHCPSTARSGLFRNGLQDHKRVTRLEVDPDVDHDRPCSRGGCDAAEVGRVDIRVRDVPHRPVQHIDRVSANSEGCSFGEPCPLLQCHVETETSRSFKAG